MLQTALILPGAPAHGPGSWTSRETRVRTAAHSERPRVHVLVLCCHRYARLQDWDSFHVFSSRAKNLVPRRTPTALYYEGISRYMEGEVLYLQKQIEGQSENAQDSGVELLKVSPGLRLTLVIILVSIPELPCL